MAALAGIQLDAEQAEGVDTDADRALGEARGVVEEEPLAPLLLLGRCRRAFAVVRVDVEVAQGEAGLAVLDEAAGGGLLGQQAKGDGQGQGRCVHARCSNTVLKGCWTTGAGAGAMRRRVTFEATVVFTGSGTDAMRRSAVSRLPL
ncbi:hypothetical protein D3C76_1365610 [compost metagenome]